MLKQIIHVEPLSFKGLMQTELGRTREDDGSTDQGPTRM
jgi:hypothetical protein